ncbi:MAG: hypothetical protein CMK32_13560 [Porticoccaceae bacterium]|nr:hypothetical protein [Porticoccaceae bacterium]
MTTIFPHRLIAALLLTAVVLTSFAATGKLRFSAIEKESLSEAQRASPAIARTLDAGRWNPNGYDALLLRNPGLMEAQLAVAREVMLGTEDDPVTLSKDLIELAIMLVAAEWQNDVLLTGHRRSAVSAGLSTQTLEALMSGDKPVDLSPEQLAVYNFGHMLLVKHQVDDGTFNRLHEYLDERQIVDLISIMGMYTNSVMLMNVAGITSH